MIFFRPCHISTYVITTKNNGAKYFGDIGQLYSGMLDQIVAEGKLAPTPQVITEKKDFPKGTFEKAGDAKKKKKNPFVGKKTGPENAEGVKPAKKADAKFSMSSEKTENQNINNCMSKNFDKLCADVLNNRLQLENPDIETIDDVTTSPESGPGGELDGELGNDLGGEGEGEGASEFEGLSQEELCSKLRDLVEVLCAKLEGGDLEGEGEVEGEDLGGEGEGAEGLEGAGVEGKVAGEATEMTELKPANGAKLQAKGNKVPGNASKVAGGKAVAKVTDTVGTEETGIHPLVSPERMNKGLNGKNNKTAGNVKPGRQIGT